MSIINQVLLNLEKRRASPAELGLLPDHVQLPPERGRASHWGWVAAGIAFAIAAPAGWIALTSTVAGPLRAPAPQPGAGGVVEKAVTASAGASPATGPGARDESYSQKLRALRLSLELSSFPAEPGRRRDAGASQAADGGREPPSTARLIGRGGADSATVPTQAEAAAAPARSARPAPAPVAPTAETAAQPEIHKQTRDPTPRELAEDEYRKAAAWLNQGRLAEAEEGFRSALSLYPENHQARQGLIGLLLQGRKLGDAERVLEEGVKLSPAQSGFSMMLARLQADRGDNKEGIATLQRGIEHAQGNAEYVAFLAALLQRVGRHEEAIGHFRAALRLRPGSGIWWLGLGMSLQAVNQTALAQSAYQQARAVGNLQPELAAFAEQRLRQLQ